MDIGVFMRRVVVDVDSMEIHSYVPRYTFVNYDTNITDRVY